MSKDWSSGLTDREDNYPSAANPLTAMGIDPDEAAANPSLLEKLRAQGQGKLDPAQAVATATAIPTPPKASAVAAGKVGGAGDTSSPPTSPAPASGQPMDEEGYGKEGLDYLSRNLKSATQAANDVPTTPPADVARLREQQEKLAVPAPRFDPATGKPLKTTQEYDPDTGKMVDINPNASTWRKIWRGVRGGLTGLAEGGIPGAIVGTLSPEKVGGEGYKDPSTAYKQAEQRREQQLGATGDQLKTSFQAWKDAVDASKAKAGEYRANATLGKDEVTGATGMINAENTKPNSPEAKLQLSQKEFEQRSQQLQTDPTLSKLSPLNKSLYLANGKLPDPREPNEADITAAQIARGIKILGHPPQTLEELNQVVSAAKGGFAKSNPQKTDAEYRQIEDKKNLEIQRAMSAYAKDPGAQDGTMELQRAVQLAQNQYEADMAIGGRAGQHMVVSVDKSGQITWTPQAAPVAPPAPATGPAAQPNKPGAPPPGATHTAKSKADGKMHYTNAQGTADYGVAE